MDQLEPELNLEESLALGQIVLYPGSVYPLKEWIITRLFETPRQHLYAEITDSLGDKLLVLTKSLIRFSSFRN